MSLKVGCLPYAVGKQLYIPLINLGNNGYYTDDDDDDEHGTGSIIQYLVFGGIPINIRKSLQR